MKTTLLIMDYSNHDAIEVGLYKIIFVIRRDIETNFRERIGNCVEFICKNLRVEVAYTFQKLHNVPGEVSVERTKPWRFGQAVFAAKDFIHEPVAVINADDYYGKEASHTKRPEDRLYQAMIDEYLNTNSIERTALSLSVSQVKARKILIIEGIQASRTSLAIQHYRNLGKATAEIAEILHTTEKAVRQLPSIFQRTLQWGLEIGGCC